MHVLVCLEVGNFLDDESVFSLELFDVLIELGQPYFEEIEVFAACFAVDLLVQLVYLVPALRRSLLQVLGLLAGLHLHQVFNLVTLVFYVIDVHVFPSHFKFFFVEFVFHEFVWNSLDI